MTTQPKYTVPSCSRGCLGDGILLYFRKMLQLQFNGNLLCHAKGGDLVLPQLKKTI